MFDQRDLDQISSQQLSPDTVNNQILKFQSGFPPANLKETATLMNGVLKFEDSEIRDYSNFYTENLTDRIIVKFVPASGAATRMFKSLYSFLNDATDPDKSYQKLQQDQSEGSVYQFFKNIEKFAFYEELKQEVKKATGLSLEEALLKRHYREILESLLEETGLNYGNLPKGLLKFHQYEEGVRTPVEEHIVEGANYARDHHETLRIHLTVSPEHLKAFREHVETVKSRYETELSVHLEISFSTQKLSTNSIAVDPSNKPFRNDDGSLLFRPAGHGALLENLNDLEADVVFIKNIDNVVPDRLKETTFLYKKALAGILLKFQAKIDQMIAYLEKGGDTKEGYQLLKDHLGFRPSQKYNSFSEEEKREFLLQKLDRPIRVCGMVKNQGDPGGGPFWVMSRDGSVSLQIVETAQIDMKDPAQKKIFEQSTHFSPTDLVCLLRNTSGKKWDLPEYRDPETGFITSKSKDGKELKAQELPGLWNGSMADWNTIFVEVPYVTFNPVKSVNDLLRGEHQK